MKTWLVGVGVVSVLLAGTGCAVDEASYCGFSVYQRVTNLEVEVDGRSVDPREFGFVGNDGETFLTSLSDVSDLNNRIGCHVYRFHLFEDETYLPIETDCLNW